MITPTKATPSARTTTTTPRSKESLPTSAAPSPDCVRSFPFDVMMGEDDNNSNNDDQRPLEDQQEQPESPLRSSSSDDQRPMSVGEVRTAILELSLPMGQLTQAILSLPRTEEETKYDIVLEPLAQLVAGYLRVAHVCQINLRLAIDHKLELNRKKYPVEICKGKAGKYTQYSSHTGITKTQGQSVLDQIDQAQREQQAQQQVSSQQQPSTQEEQQQTSKTTTAQEPQFQEWWPASVETVIQFRNERDWTRFHTPRSLALALLGELGELAEILQFDSEQDTSVSVEKYQELYKELADVTIYTISLTSYFNDNGEKSAAPFGRQLVERVQQLVSASVT